MPFELKPGVNCHEFAYVGSRVTCDPAPTDTDRDILVLCVKGEMYNLIDKLYCAGAKPCSDRDYGDTMKPVRLGEDNFLVTEDADYYFDFVYLTSAVKHLNIMDKDTRHAIFQAVLDGDCKLVGGCIPRETAPFNLDFI